MPEMSFPKENTAAMALLGLKLRDAAKLQLVAGVQKLTVEERIRAEDEEEEEWVLIEEDARFDGTGIRRRAGE
jgi:hypothetical protein